MKIRPLLFLLLLLAGCQKPPADAVPRFMREQDRFSRYARPAGADSLDGDASLPAPSAVWQTALSFPDSVAWRDGDLRDAMLLLFKNGRLQARIPAGDRPDAGRHRFAGGHLWSDSTDGFRTTLSCDGEERFSYDGEERLQGFLVVNGEVHTLGQRPDGNGFSYRINGAEVFSSPSGTVLGWSADPDREGGALFRDSSRVYYTYGIPVRTGNDLVWEYQVMQGSQVYKSLPAMPPGQLLDVRVHGGQVYRLEQRLSGLCLVNGESVKAINGLNASTLRSCKLLPDGERILVKGSSVNARGRSCWYRDGDVVLAEFSSSRLLAFYYDGTISASLEEDGNGFVAGCRADTLSLQFPQGTYQLSAQRCAQLKEGIFSVALSAASGKEQLVILEEGPVKLYFNGYFTGTYIE